MSTSIRVTWREVPSLDQNGIIITYEVLLVPMETFGGILTEQQLNSTNFSVVVTDLQEFLNYRVSVRAYTMVGPGNYSNAIIRMTLEDGKFVIVIRPWHDQFLLTMYSCGNCTLECDFSSSVIHAYQCCLE